MKAIPAILLPPPPAAAAQAAAAPAQQAQTPSSGSTGAGPLRSAAQAVSAVLPKPKAPAADVTADNGGPVQNIVRESKKFTPKAIGDSPILFGNGQGADNGIRGWGSALKKLGIGGNDADTGK